MRQDNHPDVKTYHAKHAAALAADASYSAAIVAAGFKDRWTMPSNVMRTHDAIREAYVAKVMADNQALEWQRISFKVCHPD